MPREPDWRFARRALRHDPVFDAASWGTANWAAVAMMRAMVAAMTSGDEVDAAALKQARRLVEKAKGLGGVG
jgi:hypothetical protein